MKRPKKKRTKGEIKLEEQADGGRPVPFEALAELTSSEVIAQVKMGMSRIDPIDLEDDFKEEAA
jgi:hypothetical protein